MFEIDVTPMGAVRTTTRGKFKDLKYQRYAIYKNQVGWALRAQCKEPYKGAIGLNVTFVIPVPDSWSRKKQLENVGKPVTVKPDVDNLVKGLMDAANKICWKDDNQVTEVKMRKIYGLSGEILLTIREVGA